MDVHIRQLRYFVAVAEELSFTVAAEDRLFVSQPAVSKQIRQLELSFRAALFERNSRTVNLTQAGRALLPEARRIIAQWEDAQRAVADAAAARHRTLVVGFQTRIGRGLIPAVRAALEMALPQWRLLLRQVPCSDPSAGLAGGGGVDVAFAWLPVHADAAFSWQVVTSEDRWVAMPSKHPLAESAEVDFADLAEEPFIALPDDAGPLRESWLAAGQRTVPALVGAEATTAEEALEAVASGLGVVLLTAGSAEMYRRDDVVFHPVRGLPPAELAVVWRTGDRRRAVQIFVDVCLRSAYSLGGKVAGTSRSC
ncbi:LysR family transcriptional regulator [Frankia canadensis]|nr:LysR family transcriptional regulator [Frankia canadensis]